MLDDKDGDSALATRAVLDRLIRTTPPGVTRDILVGHRDRIPIAGPGGEAPSVTPPRPRADAPMPSIDPRWRDGTLDRPGFPLDPPHLDPCTLLSSRASHHLASGDNRWWQNWGKTKAYVAERMLFPTNVYELAQAITTAERDNRPVRAVGGGWSFSDVNIPGDVDPGRPVALGVEALAELIAATQTFPTDPYAPIIASVAQPPPGGAPDTAGSIAMFNVGLNGVDTRWRYLGGGNWTLTSDAKHDLIAQRSWHGIHTTIDFSDAEFVAFAFDFGFRPVAASGEDGPGTLAMAATASGAFATGFFYNGGGMWTLSPMGLRARQLPLKELPLGSVHPRPSTPAQAMALLRPPQPVYVINTQSMASSLQQNLPNLMSEEALEHTRSTGTTPAARNYFHVEAGITMEALSPLLRHQSPPLAMEATGGNPGATLGGSLATATHGGEYNSPLLVDRVKAVHFVGPGGIQWWIEGDDSVADPDKLMAAYPCLERGYIILGSDNVAGLSGQDWLDAVVVSLGCMGVVYSMVVEVVPLFGIHEAVVETNWSSLLRRASHDGAPITQDTLRGATSDADRRELGAELLRLLEDGEANGTGISRENNRYIDLAIDPNPFPQVGAFGLPGLLRGEHGSDWKCWVLNRELTPSVPFDPKPMPKDMIGRVGSKLGEALTRDSIAIRLEDIFNVDFIRRLGDQDVPIDALIRAANQLPEAIDRVEKWLRRITSSKDTIDTILDIITAPLEAAGDSVVAGAIVSAVFSGLLGIENGRSDATAAASDVGAIGFPASGMMGTAIEIALPAEEAWPFLQTEILDRISSPFFGYISVRVCPASRAHLGMQQFAPSIMIEVVAFGTVSARRFIDDLQLRTVDRIKGGLNAMLHWGLENQHFDADALRSVPALNSGRLPKLAKFIMAKQHLEASAPTAARVFESATTRRLAL